MAAVTALLNQRTGSRQGNLNPTLYRLAATPANGVFHDATVATSGVSGCSASVPSMCNNSTPSPTALTGGLAGYLLTAGYDQVTGWGSIDGNNLLNAAGNSGFAITAAPSTLTLTAGAASGNSATLTYISLSSFAGTITQSCNVTYTGSGTSIHLPTCSFSPATVILPAGGSVTGTVTIASTAPGGAGGSGMASIGGSTMTGSLRNPANARDSAARTALPAIALGALFLGLLPGRRRVQPPALACDGLRNRRCIRHSLRLRRRFQPLNLHRLPHPRLHLRFLHHLAHQRQWDHHRHARRLHRPHHPIGKL